MAAQQVDGEQADHVWVLGLAADDEGERGRFFRRDDARVGRQAVPVERLQGNLQAFVSAMGEAIGSIPSALAGYRIDSIEINAEISASGKVSLLGNGGEVTGTGGITFKLTRVAGASGASAES